MKIALLNEFSQAPKNQIILNELESVAKNYGHEVVNAGMLKPLVDQDVPEAYTAENPRLTYLHLGIQSAILLNAKAVDFVITGCGTGQGALMALNMFPGVVCGYCIEPSDAFLYLQINNGNALSLPFAKGFGWGADVNLNNIFTKAFSSPAGMGYPAERRESQNKNAALLFELKAQAAKPIIEGLKSLDQNMVKECLTPHFMDAFLAGCQCDEMKSYVTSLV
jgi:ribose 5-phosphate isomerase B